jgi:hypothetical protein
VQQIVQFYLDGMVFRQALREVLITQYQHEMKEEKDKEVRHTTTLRLFIFHTNYNMV